MYDTTDFERVMVWTVHERASFGRELGIPLPFLGCQPDALNGAFCGEASRTRVESAYLFQTETSSVSRRAFLRPSYFSGLLSLVNKSAVPTIHHRAWVLLHCYCREGGYSQRQRETVRKLLNELSSFVTFRAPDEDPH